MPGVDFHVVQTTRKRTNREEEPVLAIAPGDVILPINSAEEPFLQALRGRTTKILLAILAEFGYFYYGCGGGPFTGKHELGETHR